MGPKIKSLVAPRPIFSYTTPTQAGAVAWATRTQPLTSPPIDHHATILYDTLHAIKRPSILYIALHGYAHQPFLYGEGTTALTPAILNPIRLPNSIIYAPTCHLTESPMLGHLLETGATVIAGSGENWSPFVHRLGRHLITYLRLRLSPSTALKLARARLALQSDHPHALDTLALRVFAP